MSSETPPAEFRREIPCSDMLAEAIFCDKEFGGFNNFTSDMRISSAFLNSLRILGLTLHEIDLVVVDAIATVKGADADLEIIDHYYWGD